MHASDTHKPLLPEFAAAVAEWFPELGGRSLAVSDIEVDPDNLPSLPIAFVAINDDRPEHVWSNSGGEISLNEDIILEFWLKVERYKTEKGAESPFFAFYDYEAFRNRLLSNIVTWVGPSGQRFEYRRFNIDATQYAVILHFELRAHSNWCDTSKEPDPDGIIGGDASRPTVPIIRIETNICRPKSFVCPDGYTNNTEKEDPCP